METTLKKELNIKNICSSLSKLYVPDFTIGDVLYRKSTVFKYNDMWRQLFDEYFDGNPKPIISNINWYDRQINNLWYVNPAYKGVYVDDILCVTINNFFPNIMIRQFNEEIIVDERFKVLYEFIVKNKTGIKQYVGHDIKNVWFKTKMLINVAYGFMYNNDSIIQCLDKSADRSDNFVIRKVSEIISVFRKYDELMYVDTDVLYFDFSKDIDKNIEIGKFIEQYFAELNLPIETEFFSGKFYKIKSYKLKSEKGVVKERPIKKS